MSDKYEAIVNGDGGYIRRPNSGGQLFGEAIVDELNRLADRIKRLEAFVRDIASNYDHDVDAHRHGTSCRVCEAEEALDGLKSKEANP